MKKIRLIGFRFFKFLGSRGYLNWISSETYIKVFWFLKCGTKLDLSNPKTFSEKLQWKKLHDKNPMYPLLVDKVEVKKIIEEKYGKDLIIPNLWVGDDVEKIPFDTLPNKFVIKCAHGSQCNIICKDKESLNIDETKRKLKGWLARNWFWYGREWPYKNVPSRMIIEPFIENNGEDLKDYKFFCFNGKVEFCQVISNRFTHEEMDFFDENWNHLPISRNRQSQDNLPESSQLPKKPAKYDQMVSFAKDLSIGHSFVRIDLYYANDRILFGEFTLFPANGICEFSPVEYNTYLGNLINLEKRVL